MFIPKLYYCGNGFVIGNGVLLEEIFSFRFSLLILSKKACWVGTKNEGFGYFFGYWNGLTRLLCLFTYKSKQCCSLQYEVPNFIRYYITEITSGLSFMGTNILNRIFTLLPLKHSLKCQNSSNAIMRFSYFDELNKFTSEIMLKLGQ